MARKTPKINVLLSISKTTFFKTSEIILEANYGTRKRDYWRDSSYFELKNSSLEGFSKKGVFWTWNTSARQHDRTFPLLSSPTFPLLSGSFNAFFLFGFQIWLERRSSRIFCFYSLGRSYNSAQASTLGEKISRFRPVDPPTNGTRRYGAKEAYPRLGSLAARQTFFQAVDRLPHPRVRWLAS